MLRYSDCDRRPGSSAVSAGVYLGVYHLRSTSIILKIIDLSGRCESLSLRHNFNDAQVITLAGLCGLGVSQWLHWSFFRERQLLRRRPKRAVRKEPNIYLTAITGFQPGEFGSFIRCHAAPCLPLLFLAVVETAATGEQFPGLIPCLYSGSCLLLQTTANCSTAHFSILRGPR